MECRLVPCHSRPVYIVVPAPNVADAATVEDHSDGHSSIITVWDDTYRRVVVAKAATLAQHAHTPSSIAKKYKLGKKSC